MPYGQAQNREIRVLSVKKKVAETKPYAAILSALVFGNALFLWRHRPLYRNAFSALKDRLPSEALKAELMCIAEDEPV
jgi:hypothetical protein